LGSSVVTTEKFSEILPSCGWGPGRGNLGQTGDVTHKKTKPKTLTFFSLHARRLTKSFEGLNSCLAQLPGKLWSCKVAQKYRIYG